MLQIIINFEKRKMLPLTQKELKLHQDTTECYICGKRSRKKFANGKIIKKVETVVILQVNIGAAHSICNVRFNVSNEIPVVFHNGSDYDDHFIIRELANEFDTTSLGQFECLGENTEKYKTFSVLIEKKLQTSVKIVMKVLPLYLTERNFFIV